MENGSSTLQLKRTLGRGDLMGMAVGQIIGAGIMSLTGVAIGMTGKSVTLAFIVAAIYVIINAFPFVILGSTVRMRGGQYTQIAFLAGKFWAGMFIICYICSRITTAMYAISFADYFLALFPGVNHKLVAFLCLTVFYMLNLFGIQGAAKIQNAMVILMAAALALFTAFGLTKIQPGVFSGPDFMPNGIIGVLSAGALLSFATGGATVIINFGAESKNPTKDVPFVIIVSTLAVAVLYALMSLVAANVLPISEVANKPLSLVAKAVLPPALFVFFIVGGAGFALTTTLNATLGWVTKPLMQACDDGWFPKKLASLNKYNVPWILLTFFYLVGLLPILIGWNISFIANSALVLNNAFIVLMSLTIVRIPKLVPDIWAKSSFHVSNGVLWGFGLLSAAATTFQMTLQLGNLKPGERIGNIVIFLIAFIYAYILSKSGKVKITQSYEAA